MYKNLTHEEKATWEARASQDKSRYDAEISSYVPPPGHDSRGILIEEARPRKRSKRGPKDPSAPKRASGAYVFFTNEMRPKILQEYPGIKFVELGRVLGERWRALTPLEKKRYEDIAAEDKVRFQLEMQQYSATQAASVPGLQPGDHYYQDPTTSYDSYVHHDPSLHHDPYAQHHAQYHTS